MNEAMKDSRLFLATYLAGTLLFPVALLYPALIYGDLAGMGGYDGYASPEMMTEYGVWKSVASDHTPIYFIFAGTSLIWLLSVVNLPIAVVIVMSRLIQKKTS
jgi:hypothetical protein